MLSLLALLLCSVAIICSSLHFARLKASDTNCVAKNILEEQGSCSCTFNSMDSHNKSTSKDNDHDILHEEIMDYEDNSYSVEYR